jgi:hypothetical protein
VQSENSGAVTDVGSSKRIDDAGHNLCALNEAAIASAMQRKEKLRLLYRSHKRDRSSVCDDGRHTPMIRTWRAGMQSSGANLDRRAGALRPQKRTNRPSIGVAESLYSADL